MENLKQAEEVENLNPESTEEAVVAEADTGTPQPDEAEQEFEIDLGTDEQTSDTVPVYKLNKLRKRAQKAEKKGEEQESENATLRAEMNELRSEMNKVSRGPRPDPMEFSTSEEFYTALDQWQGSTTQPTAAKNQEPAQAAPYQVSDSVMDSHYDNASKLPVNDYEQAEGNFREELNEAFPGEGHALADLIINEGGDKSHLITYALGKDVKRLHALVGKISADRKNGTRTTEKYLWALSEKVDIKPKKTNISTNPEEIPEGKGNADALNAQIKQAKEKWAADSSVANYQSLQKLRAKQNG